MQARPFSYKEYLEIIADSSAIKMHENSGRVIERYRSPDYNLVNHSGVIFLVEFTTQKYIYISDAIFNIFGFSVKEFKERTLDEYQSTIHPLDFEIMNKKIFPENLKFLETIDSEKYQNFIFSYNYRVQNIHGDYITLLQRFSYVPSNKSAMPFGMVGVGFDITHFKTDISVVHTIEETIIQNGELINNLIFKKIHPVYDYVVSKLLSRRELEVMYHISKGQSSKQIADKMKISINTVNNHRKRMLLKSNCKSSSELINFAVKHGLL
jgi:DNA-binding CsgD family transcriptional regulator